MVKVAPGLAAPPMPSSALLLEGEAAAGAAGEEAAGDKLAPTPSLPSPVLLLGLGPAVLGDPTAPACCDPDQGLGEAEADIGLRLGELLAAWPPLGLAWLGLGAVTSTDGGSLKDPTEGTKGVAGPDGPLCVLATWPATPRCGAGGT